MWPPHSRACRPRLQAGKYMFMLPSLNATVRRASARYTRFNQLFDIPARIQAAQSAEEPPRRGGIEPAPRRHARPCRTAWPVFRAIHDRWVGGHHGPVTYRQPTRRHTVRAEETHGWKDSRALLPRAAENSEFRSHVWPAAGSSFAVWSRQCHTTIIVAAQWWTEA